MRVLHFFKTYKPDSYGGIEQFIFQLAHGTSRQGLDVHVLSLSPDVRDQTEPFDNHTIHRVRRDLEIASTGISLRAIRKFRQLAQQADVLHLHFPWPFADLVHLLANVSRPVVLTYHSDIVRQRHLLKLYAPLMRRFLGTVDRIVATSPNYLQTSDVLPGFSRKTEVIPIGLDRATYPPDDPSLLEKWPFLKGTRFFLFVGVLRYYKGLHILLEALRGTDYQVVIVGAGPIEAELRKHAHDLGLTTVHFLGAVSDSEKVALLKRCYAGIFPSHLRAEAFGISLLEAAMYAKPLISSEVGTGTSYVNVHGETGIVVPPSDPGELRRAMATLLDSPQLARTMGDAAGERFRRHFTVDQMVDRYLSLYERIVLERQMPRKPVRG